MKKKMIIEKHIWLQQEKHELASWRYVSQTTCPTAMICTVTETTIETNICSKTMIKAEMQLEKHMRHMLPVQIYKRA